jgi:predicted dehydrogenase
MIRVGMLGYGYWGPNLARVFAETPDARLAGIADPSTRRLDAARTRHPDVRLARDPRDLMADPAIDAIVIASPVATHVPLARAAIDAGKHVLVEKPLATTEAEAARLADAADRAGRVLMVDHTFVYSGAVQEIRDLVSTGALGAISVYDATRTSLGRFQPDAGVLWDLAVHDLAILDALGIPDPIAITAVAIAATPSAPPDVALVTLHLEDGSLAHVHVNWISTIKMRRTILTGTRATLVYDDVEPSEKVKVYGRDADQIDGDDRRVAHRAGPVLAPRLSVVEPLRAMAAHFVECVRTGAPPDTGGPSGVRVARWLEAAELSIASHGRPIELAAEPRG